MMRYQCDVNLPLNPALKKDLAVEFVRSAVVKIGELRKALDPPLAPGLSPLTSAKTSIAKTRKARWHSGESAAKSLGFVLPADFRFAAIDRASTIASKRREPPWAVLINCLFFMNSLSASFRKDLASAHKNREWTGPAAVIIAEMSSKTSSTIELRSKTARGELLTALAH